MTNEMKEIKREITGYEVHQMFSDFYDGDFVLNPGDMAKFDDLAKRVNSFIQSEDKIF